MSRQPACKSHCTKDPGGGHAESPAGDGTVGPAAQRETDYATFEMHSEDTTEVDGGTYVAAEHVPQAVAIGLEFSGCWGSSIVRQ